MGDIDLAGGGLAALLLALVFYGIIAVDLNQNRMLFYALAVMFIAFAVFAFISELGSIFVATSGTAALFGIIFTIPAFFLAKQPYFLPALGAAAALSTFILIKKLKDVPGWFFTLFFVSVMGMITTANYIYNPFHTFPQYTYSFVSMSAMLIAAPIATALFSIIAITAGPAEQMYEEPEDEQVQDGESWPEEESYTQAPTPTPYTALDGHKVRSKAELLIDNYLVQKGIEHEYEPRIPQTRLYADWYLPRYNLYLEYYGLLSSYEYVKKKRLKDKVYRSLGLMHAELYEGDVANLDDAIARAIKDAVKG